MCVADANADKNIVMQYASSSLTIIIQWLDYLFVIFFLFIYSSRVCVCPRECILIAFYHRSTSCRKIKMVHI